MITTSLLRPSDAIIASGTDLGRLGFEQTTAQRLPRAKRRRSRADWRYRIRRIERSLYGLRVGKKQPKPGRNPFKEDGYTDIAEGLGGVSVSPDFFDDECYRIPSVAWAVDDIWLSGCLERQGIGIWADSLISVPDEHLGTEHAPLASSTVDDTGRHEANAQTIRYMQDKYEIWR